MRLKALAQIYIMHFFALLLESIIDKWGKKDRAKTTPVFALLCNLNFCQKKCPKKCQILQKFSKFETWGYVHGEREK